MRPSLTISLFSEQPALNERSYSFAVSILVHCAAVALLFFGIVSAPRIKPPVVAEQYTVRHLDLHTIQDEMQRAARNAIHPPRAHASFAPRHSAPSLLSAAVAPQVMRMVIQAPPSPQTLVQPDLSKTVALKVDIPIPTVAVWDGKNSPEKAIVAPLLQPPPVSDVKPSTQLPNEEQNLADIAIPASAMPVQSSPILPSTTTPVVVQGPKPEPPAPITSAEGSAQPTPTAVLSLSEHRMSNGVVTLPPVNQSASANSPGLVAAGQAKVTSTVVQDNPAAKTDGKAADNSAAKAADKPAINASGKGDAKLIDKGDSKAGNTDAKAAGKDAGKSSPSDQPASSRIPANASSAPVAQDAQSASGQGNSPSTTRITLPKEGQFASVIVGSSLVDKYPEIADLMSGQLTYTVYLHLGTPKSWILQYSLPRAGEAAEAGSVTRIEAPWPYNIVRPNIAPGDIDADALIVHGFVDLAGRFESLAIAFPPDFAQAQFVLTSLAQWQFRPATQNGRDTRVEVLLIIPEEPE